MIYLHTLEDSFIRVGEKDIRPTAPMLFAALLYLCVERGHRVSRTALQEMLFPSAGERSGAHSLRQLLYKLRQLGVPLEADTATVLLPANAVQDGSAGANGSGDVDRVSEPLLEGYAPHISPAFDRWLDERRSTHVASARAVAVSALSHARESGNYRRAEQAASALLKLDPLNEEATLARAEAMALGGQKHDAVKLLEEYSAEVGAVSPTLRVAADVLRRRITDRLVLRERSPVPMVGREDELALLLAHFARACAGQPTVTIIWGDAGIGKTRLVQEFSANVALRSARLETAHCQPHDVGRPLGALIDLVPKLLQARGALGVSPESLLQLRRLAGDEPIEPRPLSPANAELVTARIRSALIDLFLCIAGETPLVLLVEDAHWLDEASVHLLFTTILRQSARLHLVLTQRGQPHFLEGVRITKDVFIRQLAPLSSHASTELLKRAIGTAYVVDDSTLGECMALGAGNPLFLCTLAEHLRRSGSAPSARAGIADLLRQRIRILDPRSLLLLRFVAALGNHGTLARLTQCVAMPIDVTLLALQELSELGLIVRQDGANKCSHDLLAEVILHDSPPPLCVAVFERVATALEADGMLRKQVTLLWSCAEYWVRAEHYGRAAAALIRCADFATEIGQPRFAVAALEKAQLLVGKGDLPHLLEKTIDAAEAAYDSACIIRSVKLLRDSCASRAPQDLPHRIAILHLNALRRTGLSRPEHQATLRTIALDKNTLPKERLAAVRNYLIQSEADLNKEAAVDLFAALDSNEFIDVARTEWLQVSMLFHCFFGQMNRAPSYANEIVSLCDSGNSVKHALMMGNAGLVLVKAGAIFQGFQCMHRALRSVEKLGIMSLVLNDAARLTALYLAFGNRAAAATLHRQVSEIAAREALTVPAVHVASSIHFDLSDGDIDLAKKHLDELIADHAAFISPYNRRFVRAYDIAIRIADRTLTSSLLDVAELEAVHASGRVACDHDYFVHSYATALARVGQHRDAQNCVTDYFANWRREAFHAPPYFRGLFRDLQIDCEIEAPVELSATTAGVLS